MLSNQDYYKVFKGLLIALAGAVLTTSEEYLSGADFGQLTAVVVAVNSVLVNFARKWFFPTA